MEWAERVLNRLDGRFVFVAEGADKVETARDVKEAALTR